eukprot:TRINITY_DN10503_c0_g1_i1.p1 TRINITY_DN10503_c0_g1~~TRINITY_DN10503_c0_g1_i1.p1  ORF type:complete len:354 (-),score=70.45 TRINITY_DN10503_c0_g1_i1:289-1350(-)
MQINADEGDLSFGKKNYNALKMNFNDGDDALRNYRGANENPELQKRHRSPDRDEKAVGHANTQLYLEQRNKRYERGFEKLQQQLHNLERELDNVVQDRHEDNKYDTVTSESTEELFSRVFRDIHRVTYKCNDIRHVGGKPGLDGVWAVCFDDWEKHKDDCVVYSFGSNNDFAFEDDLISFTDCEVHTFDPTMGVKPHQRNSQNWFWDIGIADKKQTVNVLDMYKGPLERKFSTLEEIMKSLGHTKVWLVKMDVEYSEWSSLRQMFKSHTLDRVDQLVLEVHFGYGPRFDIDVHLYDSKKIFSNWLETLLSIRDQGFQLFYHHANPIAPLFDWGNRVKTPCCYEVYYVKPPLQQ